MPGTRFFTFFVAWVGHAFPRFDCFRPTQDLPVPHFRGFRSSLSRLLISYLLPYLAGSGHHPKSTVSFIISDSAAGKTSLALFRCQEPGAQGTLSLVFPDISGRSVSFRLITVHSRPRQAPLRSAPEYLRAQSAVARPLSPRYSASRTLRSSAPLNQASNRTAQNLPPRGGYACATSSAATSTF